MKNIKVIIVDDNEDIHKDYMKVLNFSSTNQKEKEKEKELENELFGVNQDVSPDLGYRLIIESAFQGEEGYKKILDAENRLEPFSLALVDMKMPPGWDGLRTISEIFKTSSNIQVILCTAYSDYELDEIIKQLGYNDRLLILKKPFDPIEIQQMSINLIEKWILTNNIVQQLNDLKKMNIELEKASKIKSEFLANISHELRTPMHGILSFAEIGKEELDKEEYDLSKLKDFNREILDSANRLMKLLNNLLDLSKLESKKVQYEYSDFNLNQLIGRLISEFDILANKKNLNFKSNIEVQKAYSDPQRIYQVLTNIVSNAIKFSDQDKKIIINVTSNSSNMLKVSVLNQGIGIPEKETESIFDKFIQSSKSKVSSGGTGLGLSICKEIILDLGGEIWAVNQSDGQTAFHFTFPSSKVNKESTS